MHLRDSAEGNGPRQIGYVSLFAAFTASEVRATGGEQRTGHAALLGVGGARDGTCP
ncbi:hypothetical protein [Nannocystis sp. SCPEA4]|uniref:hypothetical protein n=1 Tax=Nannocystis sp. SCPEA4 TaxID=2996787 RepID=UPI002271D925|nr:hypothetical protein [Nannocystis sp. SCPEA4]MCY1054989.1 hypothetical protein [Nannocystis sp. SCPEA4]